MRNEAIIQYCGQPAKVACDRKCNKAWGINSRPRIGNPDDCNFMADDDLPDAPADPETYEGEDAKPSSPDLFPNKWCVRECERCSMSKPGAFNEPLELTTFDQTRV